MKISEAFFDGIAPYFMVIYPSLQKDYRRLAAHLYSNVFEDVKRVLDIGCGTGTLLVELKNIDPQLECVGMDVSRKMIAAGRRLADASGVKVSFVRGNWCLLTHYPPDTFDIILCTGNSLSHYPASRVKTIVSNVFKKLRRGGIFVFDYYGKLPPLNGVKSRGIRLIKDKLYVSFFVDELRVGKILQRDVYVMEYVLRHKTAPAAAKVVHGKILHYLADRRQQLSLLRHAGFVKVTELRTPTSDNLTFISGRKL